MEAKKKKRAQIYSHLYNSNYIGGRKRIRWRWKSAEMLSRQNTDNTLTKKKKKKAVKNSTLHYCHQISLDFLFFFLPPIFFTFLLSLFFFPNRCQLLSSTFQYCYPSDNIVVGGGGEEKGEGWRKKKRKNKAWKSQQTNKH